MLFKIKRQALFRNTKTPYILKLKLEVQLQPLCFKKKKSLLTKKNKKDHIFCGHSILS